MAGGSGTRLYPLTKCISKQLLPVYDKPAIFYPLSTLMLSGIKDILIISTPRDLPLIEQLLGDGRKYGINLQYAIQDNPNGLAEAFIIGEEFIGKDPVTLILGDNLIWGDKLVRTLQEAIKLDDGALIFGYKVNNPRDFGVVEFNENGNVVSLEEKPVNPRSDYAIPGLYVYDNDVIRIAKTIRPSDRGELEITAINQVYFDNRKLKVIKLGRGVAWMDLGSFDNLIEASNFVSILQKKQGFEIACLEEISYRMGYIDKAQLIKLSEEYTKNTPNRDYLEKLIEESE